MFENKKKQGDQSSDHHTNLHRNQQSCQSQGDNRNNNKRKGIFLHPETRGQNLSMLACKNYGKNHPRECRQGTNICYKCGKEGHFAKGYIVSISMDNR